MHGGSSLAEWYFSLQGQGLRESVDGYFTTLGGRILVLVWVGCRRWFSVVGSGVERFVLEARRRRSLKIGEWQRTYCGGPLELAIWRGSRVEAGVVG